MKRGRCCVAGIASSSTTLAWLACASLVSSSSLLSGHHVAFAAAAAAAATANSAWIAPSTSTRSWPFACRLNPLKTKNTSRKVYLHLYLHQHRNRLHTFLLSNENDENAGAESVFPRNKPKTAPNQSKSKSNSNSRRPVSSRRNTNTDTGSQAPRRVTTPSGTNTTKRSPKQPQRSSSARPRSSQSLALPLENQIWRVFGVEVHPDLLLTNLNQCNQQPPIVSRQGATSTSETKTPLHPAVLQAVRTRLRYPNLPVEDISLVRRSIDARLNQRRSDGNTGPRYVYVLDVTMEPSQPQTQPQHDNQIALPKPKNFPWLHQPGRLELLQSSVDTADSTTSIATTASSELPVAVPLVLNANANESANSNATTGNGKPRVIIVGAGPAGLFCALELVKTGLVTPILLERGQPVESRGKDIGALMHRQQFDTESNFCFGEGGAGTWSDGKLTTRIGRNSDSVRRVLTTFVQYGAPENILVEGAPHLGTDNLVRLLRNMRLDLRAMGGEIHFGVKVTGLIRDQDTTGKTIRGVDYVVHRKTVERNMVPVATTTITGSSRSNTHGDDDVSETHQLVGNAVVLATGHSARDMYEHLHSMGVRLEEKGFAVGYRVEHPQALINRIQYGRDWGPSVITGKSMTDGANGDFFESTARDKDDTGSNRPHAGVLPVPSYRLATNKAHDGEEKERGVYSFCMCPGGQIVPASTNPNELCVNGMSFSRRDSLWANSALVVTVDPQDKVLEPYRQTHGVLAGIEFQRDMERRAALMGGGNLTVPVQRVTDFLAGRASITAPSSSYRLGVKPSPCHEIYPAPLVTSLRHALVEHFNRQMPGYVCDDALLHGVETRTSSPVRISRDDDTLQAVGMDGLYPAGEGAGFAGGIVSAAVDGMSVANAILANFYGQGNTTSCDRVSAVGSFY